MFTSSCAHGQHPTSGHCHPCPGTSTSWPPCLLSHLSPAPPVLPIATRMSQRGCCQIFCKVFNGSPSHSVHCERNCDEHYLDLWFRKRWLSHTWPISLYALQPRSCCLQPFWRLFPVFLLWSLYIGILSFWHVLLFDLPQDGSFAQFSFSFCSLREVFTDCSMKPPYQHSPPHFNIFFFILQSPRHNS